MKSGEWLCPPPVGSCFAPHYSEGSSGAKDVLLLVQGPERMPGTPARAGPSQQSSAPILEATYQL